MISRIAFRGVALATLASVSCGPIAPSVAVLPAVPAGSLPDRPVQVPLRPYFRELRTVQVTSGFDTLTFLLDTGGGHTVLTTEAAQALGCKSFGRSVGHRMSGERVEFQRCTGVTLEVGGSPLHHSEIAVFDLSALLPATLPRLDGLLSLKSFANSAVTIDLPGERLIVESDASATTRRSEMQALVARVATGEDGSTLTVFLAARGDPGPVWLLLDNGNLVGTMLAPHAARQVGLRAAGPEAELGTISAAIEVMGIHPIQERVQIRELIHDGVLGASFMRRGPFLFDFRGKDPWVGIHVTGQP